MWKRKRLKYILALMLAALSFCVSCTQVNYENCPVYPVAGAKVAVELEKLNYSEFPNMWEWVGRIDKLRQELEVCG